MSEDTASSGAYRLCERFTNGLRLAFPVTRASQEEYSLSSAELRMNWIESGYSFWNLARFLTEE